MLQRFAVVGAVGLQYVYRVLQSCSCQSTNVPLDLRRKQEKSKSAINEDMQIVYILEFILERQTGTTLGFLEVENAEANEQNYLETSARMKLSEIC